MVAFGLISANPAVSPEEWERQGDAALAAGNYADAVHAFDGAAERTTETSRIAAKQATAYFHMGRYRDAERYYRADLESEPGDLRRAQAHFNIGTTQLFASEGRDAVRLAESIRSFDRCLQLNPADEKLRDDARHNLELAKLLWKRANKSDAPPPESEPSGNDRSADANPPQKNGADPSASPSAPGSTDGSRTGTAPGSVAEPRPAGANAIPTPGAGQQLVPIPESEQNQPLSPAEARQLLRQATERIARDRRALQKAAGTGAGRGYPDW